MSKISFKKIKNIIHNNQNIKSIFKGSDLIYKKENTKVEYPYTFNVYTNKDIFNTLDVLDVNNPKFNKYIFAYFLFKILYIYRHQNNPERNPNKYWNYYVNTIKIQPKYFTKLLNLINKYFDNCEKINSLLWKISTPLNLIMSDNEFKTQYYKGFYYIVNEFFAKTENITDLYDYFFDSGINDTQTFNIENNYTINYQDFEEPQVTNSGIYIKRWEYNMLSKVVTLKFKITDYDKFLAYNNNSNKFTVRMEMKNPIGLLLNNFFMQTVKVFNKTELEFDVSLSFEHRVNALGNSYLYYQDYNFIVNTYKDTSNQSKDKIILDNIPEKLFNKNNNVCMWLFSNKFDSN